MRRDNRQIALTTLIDLLVQILFVLTIILLAREVGKEVTGGYDLLKPWQRLVAAIGLSNDKRHPDKISEEGERKIKEFVKRIKELEEINAKLRARLKGVEDSRPRDGRAPGKPICKGANNSNLRIIGVMLKSNGMITVEPLDEWKMVSEEVEVDESLIFGRELSADQFLRYFRPVFNYSDTIDCRYVAKVRFESGISGDVLYENQKLIGKFFYPS